MSSRAEHDLFGFIAGVLVTGGSALAAGRTPSIGELVGGAVGGLGGSHFPDVLEPATHPNHRAFAHSATVLAATTAGAVPAAASLQNKIAGEAQAVENPVLRFLAQVGAGMPTGAAAGYASHLVADATTPKSIPLLGIKSGD